MFNLQHLQQNIYHPILWINKLCQLYFASYTVFDSILTWEQDLTGSNAHSSMGLSTTIVLTLSVHITGPWKTQWVRKWNRSKHKRPNDSIVGINPTPDSYQKSVKHEPPNAPNGFQTLHCEFLTQYTVWPKWKSFFHSYHCWSRIPPSLKK